MDETRKITRLLIQPALKKLYAGAMLILAIDTALDAWIFGAGSVVRHVIAGGRHVVADGRHIAGQGIRVRYAEVMRSLLAGA